MKDNVPSDAIFNPPNDNEFKYLWKGTLMKWIIGILAAIVGALLCWFLLVNHWPAWLFGSNNSDVATFTTAEKNALMGLPDQVTGLTTRVGNVERGLKKVGNDSLEALGLANQAASAAAKCGCGHKKPVAKPKPKPKKVVSAPPVAPAPVVATPAPAVVAPPVVVLVQVPQPAPTPPPPVTTFATAPVAGGCVSNCGPHLEITDHKPRQDGRCVLVLNDDGVKKYVRLDEKKGPNRFLLAALVPNESGDFDRSFPMTHVGYIDGNEKKTIEMNGTPNCAVAVKAFSEDKVFKWTAPRLHLGEKCKVIGRV